MRIDPDAGYMPEPQPHPWVDPPINTAAWSHPEVPTCVVHGIQMRLVARHGNRGTFWWCNNCAEEEAKNGSDDNG